MNKDKLPVSEAQSEDKVYLIDDMPEYLKSPLRGLKDKSPLTIEFEQKHLLYLIFYDSSHTLEGYLGKLCVKLYCWLNIFLQMLPNLILATLLVLTGYLVVIMLSGFASRIDVTDHRDNHY